MAKVLAAVDQGVWGRVGVGRARRKEGEGRKEVVRRREERREGKRRWYDMGPRSELVVAVLSSSAVVVVRGGEGDEGTKLEDGSSALWIPILQPTTTRDYGQLRNRLMAITRILMTRGAQIQLISEAVSKPLIHRRIEALAAKLRRRCVPGAAYGGV